MEDFISSNNLYCFIYIFRISSTGWSKCKKACPICPYTFKACNQIIGKASGYKHEIEDTVNCQTKKCIYYWTCTKSNCKDHPENEYVGRSKRRFQDRYSEHRDYPKADNTSEPSGEHFTLPGHDVSQLKGMVI